MPSSFGRSLWIAALALLVTCPLYADVLRVPANFNASSPVNGTVELTWNDVAGETEYYVLYGPGGITSSTGALPADTTSHTMNLSCCTSWHFRIRACTDGTNCSETGVVGQTPDGSNGIPPVPTGFTLWSTQAGTNVATWNEALSETSYEVLWGPYPPGPTMSVLLPANRWHVNFSGLNPGISYHFQIRACNAAGCSNFTNVVGQTPDGATPCVLLQQAWFAGGLTTLSYVVGANVSTRWNVWAIGDFGLSQLWLAANPASSPTATGDLQQFQIAPPAGVIGFFTDLTTVTGGLVCSDFDTVNTGSGSNSTASSLRPLRQPPLPASAAPQRR